MDKNRKIGKQSIGFGRDVYIKATGSVVGTKEGEGPLKNLFDVIGKDDMFGANTWEEAESTLQKEAVSIALGKAHLGPEQIDCMFAGDLLGQAMATTFGLAGFDIPLFGVYGACSTCGESLLLGSMAIAGGVAEHVVCVTSSHFASAEKEFRFPLEYGNQRPLSSTWTVTGSGAFVLVGKEGDEGAEECEEGAKTTPKLVRITAATPGKIVDYGIKDSFNMGACMAPAAASTIEQHFKDLGTKPEEYDRIITGDLGTVGQTLLIQLLKERGYDISKQHMDCGIEIFDGKKQDTHAGGSGCGCSAVTLATLILKKLGEGEWKKVLFVPTGALLSKTSFNEGDSVPGIAHGLVLESSCQ